MSGQLWIVKIHDDELDYDKFQSGVVWADTPDRAEQVMRDHLSDTTWTCTYRLLVEPAPTSGVVHESILAL